MISKGIIEKFYEAAHIQRWNDHVRPVEFTELDKQAHKMVLAYLLAKFEEHDRDEKINWINIIEGGLFEFLHRVILTDIKPQVFHKMMKAKGHELNKWVFGKICSDIQKLNVELKDRFEKYFSDTNYSKSEKRILKAAHYLASNWEFKIIYHACPNLYGINKTKEEIENEIEDHHDLIGVQKILLGKKSFGFVELCGQLRLQKRWAQSPRIPRTSVLGHMLIVAFLSYLCSYEINACEKRKYNNFYCALFHDLPEVLTRDISSPVKSSVEGLEEIILEYEAIQIEQNLLPLLPVNWHDEINYFLTDQFENRIIENGHIRKGITEMQRYNDDQYSPVDGKIIKACDQLAAFIEASLSIQHGIRSNHLIEGHKNLKERYKSSMISGINFGKLFEYY